ncbi:MAG: hypothetical protein K2M17_05125, partial [Bacilli bacterium]|nr:hypothetical protein [Bacilli bacterium]
MQNNLPLDPDGIFARGYSPVLEKWVCGNLINIDNEIYISGIEPGTNTVKLHKVLPQTLTNYTGFCDRNNVPMYTGDIIKIDYISEMKYIYSCADKTMLLAPLGYMSSGKSFDEVQKISINLNDDIVSKIEVIGNVMTSVIPGLMEDYKKSSKETMQIDDEYDDDDDEYDFFSDAEIEEDFAVELYEEDSEEIAMKDILSSSKLYRGLSLDTQTWIYGKPYFNKDDNDANGLTNCMMVNTSTGSVREVLVDTIGIVSEYIDKFDKVIYSGDVIVLDDEVISVIMYKKEYESFCLIQYNVYETVLSQDIDQWQPCMDSTWKN